jgi:predicted membrane-bound dolichyl-phosphate-mannose-protein mannosyltransferase
MADITYAAGRDELQRARWASVGNVLAGVWLMVAPFALNFGSNGMATWNHLIVGAVVLVLAAIRAFNPSEREGISWVNVVLGIWMIVSPYLLGYADVNPAQTNSLITGALILILAAFSAYETNEAHRESEGRMTIR